MTPQLAALDRRRHHRRRRSGRSIVISSPRSPERHRRPEPESANNNSANKNWRRRPAAAAPPSRPEQVGRRQSSLVGAASRRLSCPHARPPTTPRVALRRPDICRRSRARNANCGGNAEALLPWRFGRQEPHVRPHMMVSPSSADLGRPRSKAGLSSLQAFPANLTSGGS